ncbi:hypothetical protein BX616_005203 [Lobosporangium transversale]|nr:hypothetical protein BX616_005203 [Lobosporangium transversale]
MIGTSSNARVRQILILTCLCIIFLLSLIIMGLVGVHGKITFRSFTKGCVLYMSDDGQVISYNNGYCLFPIIAGAVIAVLSLIFILYLSMVIHRNDEFSPRSLSFLFFILSTLLALLAFAITAEIGIGLNKGCKLLGDQSDRCRATKSFKELWVAEICAGIAGGLWVIIMLLELFQIKSHPRGLMTSTADHVGQTTVVPHRADDQHHHRSVSLNNPYRTHPTNAAPSTAIAMDHGHKEEYTGL